MCDCGQGGCGCESIEVPYIRGTPGDSAYQVWLSAGNVGSVNDYLESLNGTDGTDGADAYDIAVEEGFIGNRAAWLASLVGAAGTNGTDGDDGIDAYSLLSGTFTVPSLDGPPNSVTIDAATPSSWVGVDQPVYLEGAGMFRVYNANAASVQLMNPGPLSWSELEATGYPGNAAPGTVIPIGSKLSPGGRAGKRGTPGINGTNGGTGSTGADGPQGVAGTDGTRTLWLNASPSSQPSTYGNIGDIVYDTSVVNQLSFWSKTGPGTWTFMGKLTGYNGSGLEAQSFNVGRVDDQPIAIGSTTPMILQLDKYTGGGNFNGGLWNGSTYVPLPSPATPQVFRLEHLCICGETSEDIDFTVEIQVNGVAQATGTVSIVSPALTGGIAALSTPAIVMTALSTVRVVITPVTAPTEQWFVDNTDLVFYNQI